MNTKFKIPFSQILKAKFPELNVIETLLPDGEYIKEVTKKRQGVLHHSASMSIRFLRDVWTGDGRGPISTALAIEQNGDVYILFDPNFWGFHTGRGRTVDKYNVGCEMANVGPVKQKDGKWFWNYPLFNYPYTGKVIDLGHDYRGCGRFWAAYTEEQLIVAAKVYAVVCKHFGIPCEYLESFDFKPEYANFRGVVDHHDLYLQKADTSPVWEAQRFEKLLKEYYSKL